MMRFIKKASLMFVLTGMLCLGGTSSAMAFDLFGDSCDRDPSATVCQDNTPQNQSSNSIYGKGGIISDVVNILAIIVGFAAVVVIIVAGIQYMLSTGDPTKVNNAKNAIIYAVVGLAIAVVARTVVVFVISKL